MKFKLHIEIESQKKKIKTVTSQFKDLLDTLKLFI